MTAKYTSKELPVVSQETLDSFLASFPEKPIEGRISEISEYGKFLEEAKRRLIKENPVLVDFINQQVGKYPPEYHLPMFEVLIGVYAVLEAQAEANKLEELL